MHAFGELSIRQKLTMMGILASGTAILLACTAFLTYELFAYRGDMIRSLFTQAEIVGANSAAAILFNDEPAAAETLAALKADPHIVSAGIYTRGNRAFATYGRSDKQRAVALREHFADHADGHWFESDGLILFRKIVFKGETIGTVYIQSDLEEMYARFWQYLAIIFVVLLTSSSVAFFISSKLQRKLTRPLFHLVETAQTVSREKDYTIRAVAESQDEMGVLVRAFNEMLVQIQQRDAALRKSTDEMEQQVLERTAQLQHTNMELAQSEERFRSVAQSANDAIISADSAERILTWNKGARMIFGYTEEEVVGKPLTLLMSERDRGAHRKGLEQVRASGETGGSGSTIELHGLRKDGNEFPLEISLATWDAGGNTFYSGIVRDITERKRAEEAIRQSEEYFRLLVANVKDYAILMLDPDGHVVSWNAGAERIKGYQAGEIIGQHFSRFYFPEDIHGGKPEHELKVAATEGRFEDEGWRVRKDGTRFWANVIITAIRDEAGTLRGFSKVTRDVTERKRAEEEFRKSEEKYRTLFDSVDEGVCTIEVLFDGNEKPIDYRFLEVNPSFEKQTGIQSAPGRRMREIAPLHEESWFEIYGRIALTGESARFENQAVQLGRWYEVYALRVGEPKERQVAILFKDITERKRTEEAIKIFNEQLQVANKELEAFSYSVSHDLRAPLRSIDGFSLALLEDCGATLGPENTEHLQRIRRASQHMAQLIDDLLNLSRVTRSELQRVPVDLSALTQGIVEDLRGTAPARPIDVVITSGLVAAGDARLLRVVLENLLGNAWKFTRKRPRARIEFGAINYDGAPAYFVRDDGAGFDMAHAGKLFGAFQRIHATTEFEGTGIGLATVQRVIHKHGGRVWAESAPEQGATFYFTLPDKKDL